MDKHLKDYLEEKQDLEERLRMLNDIIEAIQARCNYDQHKNNEGHSYMAHIHDIGNRSFYKCGNCQCEMDYLSELCIKE